MYMEIVGCHKLRNVPYRYHQKYIKILQAELCSDLYKKILLGFVRPVRYPNRQVETARCFGWFSLTAAKYTKTA